MGLFSSIGNLVGKVLGIDDGADAARKQEELLRQQREAAKLQAANEVQNVVQFDEEPDPSFAGTDDTRRKKRSTGSYASGIGLNI